MKARLSGYNQGMLRQIVLENFRNYSHKKLAFSEKITLVIGNNAAGKTNLLEAIYLLSTGKSFRAGREQEMIRKDKNLARVKGFYGGKETLEVVVTTGLVLGKKVPYKRFLVNGVGKRLFDFAGSLPAVLFWPEDLELITDSPTSRRRYLDLVLSQVDSGYRRASMVYDKALRVRNRILAKNRDQLKKKPGFSFIDTADELIYWDKTLIENGQFITRKRAEFIDFLNNFKVNSFLGKAIHFQIDYDRSEISKERLLKYKTEELFAGVTLVGPHRDDFVVFLNKRRLSSFGSRGEQRLGVLWLKLGELAFVEKSFTLAPILLLDDIFSELDEKNRNLVMEIAKKQQTVITSADPAVFPKTFLNSALRLEVEA